MFFNGDEAMTVMTDMEIESVSGGNAFLVVLATATFFACGGYEKSIDFVSGAMEGFMDAGN